MKIRFLQDYQVKAEGGESFKAGVVYDLPALSAQHFLRKNRAEIVNDKPAEPTAPEEKPQSPPQGPAKGDRGGDPIKRFQKGQSDFRKKALKGDDE